MLKRNYSVIVPKDVYPKPSDREMSAAYILNNYFRSDIKFVVRTNNKTPDFIIKGLYWELKSPTGNGKYNLQHALRNAVKQSENIIIDARFSKSHINRIRSELEYQFRRSNNIRRLLLIDKQKNVIEIFKN
jgi:hypothetical protein